MYLMFLDESGTHASSPCLILAGFAIHEHDAHHLQRALNGILSRHLATINMNAQDFELHANEIKNPQGRKHKYSPWRGVHHPLRRKILADSYKTLSNFHTSSNLMPLAAFAVVVDKRKYGESIDREQIAYELVLNKFDAMLGRLHRETGESHRGLVIHDERVVAEKDIQSWTDSWRQAAGRVGQLSNFAEVPLFADSRASRLLQAADLFAYAVWRYYGLPTPDETYIKTLWSVFDHVNKDMHGIIHMTPDFATGKCLCPPCASRTNNGSLRRFTQRKKFTKTAVAPEDIERLKEFFNTPYGHE